MVEIETRVEKERGCGFRKPGGKYLVSGGTMAACEKLPVPLGVCPTCHAGIKPTRGWTWIEVPPLVGIKFAGPEEYIAEYCEAGHCQSCPFNGSVWKAGLLWIGEKFYATPADFLKEASELGVSRRISAVPNDFKIGETWVAFAHRKGIVEWCIPEGETSPHADPDCPHCEGAGEVWTPAIFHAFKPTAIEYVVTGKETEAQLEKMVEQGFTLVRVIRENGELLQDIVMRSWEIRYLKHTRKGIVEIDQTSVDEEDPVDREALVWKLFAEFGHKRTVRTWYEETEVVE